MKTPAIRLEQIHVRVHERTDGFHVAECVGLFGHGIVKRENSPRTLFDRIVSEFNDISRSPLRAQAHLLRRIADLLEERAREEEGR
jgi:hypothetical protein